MQPTFVRFVFEMPDGVGVSSVLNEQKLTLIFNAALNLDLADAKVAAPPNVASIKQKADIDQTTVEIALIGDSDVHSFRDDKNYVVDVAFQPDKARTAATADAMIAPANTSPRMIALQSGKPFATRTSSERTSERPASKTIEPCAKLKTPDALKISTKPSATSE